MTEVEQNAVETLIGMLRKDGPFAFSLQGPNRATIDDQIKAIAAYVFESAGGSRAGGKSMDTVFAAVEDWVEKNLSEHGQVVAMGALDHRFDQIGYWTC